MSSFGAHKHFSFHVACLKWGEISCNNRSCPLACAVVTFDSCVTCQDKKNFCRDHDHCEKVVRNEIEEMPEEFDVGILQANGSVRWYGADRELLAEEVLDAFNRALPGSNPINSSGGFYKYRCKYFLSHNCNRWVWVNNNPCPTCLVRKPR